MEIEQLLKDANQIKGADAFALDENNVCSVIVGGDLAVRLVYFPERGELLTCAEIGPEPTEGREFLYRTMLKAMFMFNGTAGATVSIDEEEGELCLLRRDPLSVFDAEGFLRMLDEFAQVARKWRKALLEFGPCIAGVDREVRREQEEWREAQFDGSYFQV